jgi:hypothetical protein
MITAEVDILRHFLASIAYHATKAIKNAPDNYPELDMGMGVRRPMEILNHISSVLTYAHSFYDNYDSTWLENEPWKEEVNRFYQILTRLDRSIQEKIPKGVTYKQILQGPFSDAMAHTGQLLMLRRLAGSPVPSENFIYADIEIGVLGPDQPEPVAPDN